MLLKWILCRVDHGQGGAFAKAQEAWRELRSEPGFLGQCGAWVAAEEERASACILGMWSSRAAHATFLEQGAHDAIVQRSGQMVTLQDWSTTLFDLLLPMPGRFPDLAQALAHAPESALLRVADCSVEPSMRDTFLAAQETIWRPAMQQADGMLGGCFSGDGEGRFLVTTLWESAAFHARYAREDLPSLREEVTRRGALPTALRGHALPLLPAWTVTPGGDHA